ncbi:MAG: SCO family protein [Luteibaculum sp.]
MRLPVYGNPTEIINENGELDTIDHRIAEFELINEHGESFSSEQLDSTIYVAAFFFTRCPSICPRMTSQMVRLQLKMDNDAFEDIRFVMHTVDPRNDSAEVLLKYEEEKYLDKERTILLTGTQEDIYRLGVQSYLLASQEDIDAPGGFLHSEKFVLIDRQGRIRGFYDGTNTEEVDRLADEIKLLMKEEAINEYNREKSES